MTDEMIISCKQARLLTRQLLNLTRDQGGQASPFELAESLKESITLLQRLVPSHIDFTSDFDVNPLWISGNENAFQQVIMNLVINGCDAIEEKGTIQLSTFLLNSSITQTLTAGVVRKGRYVCIQVKDSGKGMDNSTISQIFEPFFTSKGNKGTGLGLTVVYTALVRRMKGAIQVDSTVGKGTCFSIYLPLIHHSPIKYPLEDKLDLRLDGLYIIVLEDHDLVRKSLLSSLQSYGAKCLDFNSGTEFLKWFKTQSNEDLKHYHAVLSDVVMPGMSGPEVWVRVRDIVPDLPFLFLTGYADDILSKYHISSQNSLSKPVSTDHLVRKLHQIHLRAQKHTDLFPQN